MKKIFIVQLYFSRSLSGDEEGMLCDTISRKTLFYLKATLNSAFHDYDFSNAKVDRAVLNHILHQILYRH